MKKYLNDYVRLFLVSGTVLLLDQVTKYIVRTNLRRGEIFPQGHWITGYVRFIHWDNAGTVGGGFQGMGNVFAVLSLIVAAGIIIYFPRIDARERALRLGLSLILGGALGNLLDRLFLGHVVDFISIGNIPAAFNIADFSLLLGMLALAYVIWKREEKPQPKESSAKSE